MTMLHNLIKGYELGEARSNFGMYNPAYWFTGLQGRICYGRIAKSCNREDI